jgi:hypothetical protein
VESTGYSDRILAAVVDENLASHCCARRSPDGPQNPTAGLVKALLPLSHNQIEVSRHFRADWRYSRRFRDPQRLVFVS